MDQGKIVGDGTKDAYFELLNKNARKKT